MSSSISKLYAFLCVCVCHTPGKYQSGQYRCPELYVHLSAKCENGIMEATAEPL